MFHKFMCVSLITLMNRHCSTHFIAIYEGLTPSTERLATICGQDKKE